MFSIFSQLLINSFIAGAIYALVASGFSLIYSVNKFIHFAHGAVIAFSAYVLYFLFNLVGINFLFSVVLTIISSLFLGYILNFFIYKQLRKKKSSSVILLVASVGLLILLESLILIFFGASVKTIGFIDVAQGLSFLGAVITPLQIFIIFFSLVLLVFLFLFIKKTKIGKAMRAVSDNEDVAKIVGINSEKIYSWSFVIGSGIAGIAGILVSLEQNLEPMMGTSLMVKSFAAAIIGGIGNVYGAVFGAFFLGIVENFGIWFIPSGYKDAIAFTLLIIFLLFKPNGIFGIKRRKH